MRGIVLPHPISAEQSVLRPSLLPQLVETLGRNRAHQIDEAALFEIGTTFRGEAVEQRESGVVIEVTLDGEPVALVTTCEDIGWRGCEVVPDMTGFEVAITISGSELVVDRFDSGAVVEPGLPELQTLAFGSFSGNTTGGYALILMGELPAAEE